MYLCYNNCRMGDAMMPKKTVIKLCIFIFVLGVIVGITSLAIAESIQSEDVLYDNSNSNTSNDNVQDVLDDLYSIYDHSGVGFSLLTHTPTGLSTELVGGLYRYQGVQDANNNVDNYICFGTTNKSTCIGDTDKYMYRIIGINPSGQMKLIKKEALNTAYAWNSTPEVDWAHSELYAGLNGSYFLTNTTYIPNSNWSSKISTIDWHYASFTNESVGAETMYVNEISAAIVSAKIGLMYVHDYTYGLVGGNNCSSVGEYSTCKKSWIHLSKNDTEAPNSWEWTMSRYDNIYAWRIASDGFLRYYWAFTESLSVRPVFFLRASERIVSGSGTLTDPYILG